jgi:hypothetical protein
MLKFVEREQLLSLVKHYDLELKNYSFRWRMGFLMKIIQELQDEENKSKVFSGQILSNEDAISRC